MEVKSFTLNRDFGIDCQTKVVDGVKLYSVYVVLISVPFLEIVESVERLTSPEEANRVFKMFSDKYRFPLNVK